MAAGPSLEFELLPAFSDVELAKGEKTVVEYAPEFVKQEKTSYNEQSRTIFSCPVG